jgi:hypothetical protein
MWRAKIVVMGRSRCLEPENQGSTATCAMVVGSAVRSVQYLDVLRSFHGPESRTPNTNGDTSNKDTGVVEKEKK